MQDKLPTEEAKAPVKTALETAKRGSPRTEDAIDLHPSEEEMAFSAPNEPAEGSDDFAEALRAMAPEKAVTH